MCYKGSSERRTQVKFQQLLLSQLPNQLSCGAGRWGSNVDTARQREGALANPRQLRVNPTSPSPLSLTLHI